MKLYYIFFLLIHSYISASNHGHIQKEIQDTLYLYEDRMTFLIHNTERTPKQEEELKNIVNALLDHYSSFISANKLKALQRLKHSIEGK